MRLLGFHRHPVSDETLSAYLDSRLSKNESERIEAHLHSCADCSRKLEGMRALIAELRRLPQAATPRSFALTPDQAMATRRPVVERERAANRRLYLGLSGATVAAAVLLFALVGADMLGVAGGGSDGEQTTSTLASRQAKDLPSPSDANAGVVAGNGAMEQGNKEIAPSAPLPSTVDSPNGFSANATSSAATPQAAVAVPPQEAQPVAEESHPSWLWMLEGATGGLVVGFGVSAFWMRRRSRQR